MNMNIGPVVRGVGLPNSVSPSQTAMVQVTIDPPLTDGQHATFEIIAASADSGTAMIIGNSQLSASGTIRIQGGQFSTVGNGNGLRIRGVVNNVEAGTSPPFTVCAHPVGVRYEYISEVTDDPDRIGIILQVSVVSDSGNSADLSEVSEKELVSPDFGHTGGLAGAPSEKPVQDKVFHPASDVPNDRHTTGKVTIHGRNQYKLNGAEGSWSNDQLDVFTCQRCGIEEPGALIRCSGYRLTRTIFTQKGQLMVRFRKEPTLVKIGDRTADPGLSDIIERDVVVPELDKPLPPLAKGDG